MNALAFLLANSLAVAAPVPREPEKQVSEKVLKAWKEAGAEVRWKTTNGRCYAEFYFKVGEPDHFNDLPEPEAPFQLDWISSDRDFKELVKFQNLISLKISGRRLTDDGMKEIAKLKSLESLDLQWSKITATGLKELAKLKSLNHLTLDLIDTTADMLKEIATCEGLTKFQLSYCDSEVTPEGIKHLAKLKNLTKLSFSSVPVPDKCAKEIGAITSLKKVRLVNTEMTEAGEKTLSKLLPQCDIAVYEYSP